MLGLLLVLSECQGGNKSIRTRKTKGNYNDRYY